MPSGPLPHPPDDAALSAAKSELRREVLRRRRERPAQEALGVAGALARTALAWEPLAVAGCVAAYVSVGTEPGTDALLEALRAAGTRVLVPVLLEDGDLDWAPYEGTDSLVPAGRGLREPVAPRLGREAVRQAQVVLVPGLAVDGLGTRLGRGGGSYDRALARVGAGVPVAIVLHDDEVLPVVPAQEHDRPVSHALTPSGVRVLS